MEGVLLIGAGIIFQMVVGLLFVMLFLKYMDR